MKVCVKILHEVHRIEGEMLHIMELIVIKHRWKVKVSK